MFSRVISFRSGKDVLIIHSCPHESLYSYKVSFAAQEFCLIEGDRFHKLSYRILSGLLDLKLNPQSRDKEESLFAVLHIVMECFKNPVWIHPRKGMKLWNRIPVFWREYPEKNETDKSCNVMLRSAYSRPNLDK